MEPKKSLYMLALMPPSDLSAEIHQVREEFGAKYNCKAALKPPVHITLQEPFHMVESMEKQVIDILNPIAYYQESFPVKLENFGFFPSNGVVYIAVEPCTQLKTFHRNLISRLKKTGLDEIRYTMSLHPHITIGYRDIPKELYETAKADYEEKHFRGQFSARSFFLWKHDGKKWQVNHEFEFLAEKKPQNFIALYNSPIGLLEIIASDKALLELNFVKDNETAGVARPNTITRATELQLEKYFNGELMAFDLPLQPAGTDFQLKIWKHLVEIPYGEKLSYQALSRRYGDEKAIRAVGLANGKNPIPIIIPCHRVIGADGKLTGYSGGMWRKQWLLEHELKHSGIGQQMLIF